MTSKEQEAIEIEEAIADFIIVADKEGIITHSPFISTGTLDRKIRKRINKLKELEDE